MKFVMEILIEKNVFLWEMGNLMIILLVCSIPISGS